MNRIYIAGKLNDEACDYIENVRKMIINAEEVRKAGFAVFIPGIDLLCGLVNGNWTYKDYFINSQPWLLVSDGIYVQGKNWKESPGTLKEIQLAKEKRIPIFYQEDNGLKEMIYYFKKRPDWVEPDI